MLDRLPVGERNVVSLGVWMGCADFCRECSSSRSSSTNASFSASAPGITPCSRAVLHPRLYLAWQERQCARWSGGQGREERLTISRGLRRTRMREGEGGLGQMPRPRLIRAAPGRRGPPRLTSDRQRDGQRRRASGKAQRERP